MSTAEGGTATADPADPAAGVAPELKHWKVFDVQPQRCKGRAWEAEVKVQADTVLQIRQALDTVRPSLWEPTDFDGPGYFVEGCALCDQRWPCAMNECVNEHFVEFRSCKIVFLYCTCSEQN
jgi:hypothetical protein